MTRAILVIAALGTAISFAAAQPQATNLAESGNSFLATCENAGNSNDTSVSSFTRGLCFGYVSGVSDGIELAQSLPSMHADYCLPSESTNGQKFDTVVKFIKQHPEIRHWQTRELLLRGLTEAFPCPATQKR